MSRFYMECWFHYTLTQEKGLKILQKHCPTEILQFSWTAVLTVECFRDCLMPSGGLIDMASVLSLLNLLSIIPTYHSLMPGHSQASKTAGADRGGKTKLFPPPQLWKWVSALLMRYSCSTPKPRKGERGIKGIRACYPTAALPSACSCGLFCCFVWLGTCWKRRPVAEF